MFEWDEDKNRRNIEKHGISFETASRIFENAVLTLPDKRRDYEEERLRSIGNIDTLLVLAVIHTDRNGNMRLISARRANRKERKLYDKTI